MRPLFLGEFLKSKEAEYGAMIKKNAKNKTALKKKAKKKGTTRGKKELSPAEVRKNIAGMVKSEAAEMADAVIGEGKKGQLATVKYLFEVASIYPPSTDGSQASAEEESLAATLLRRLDMPDEPVARDEEDAPVKAEVLVEKAVAKPEDASEGQEPVAEPETREEGKEPVLV